MKIKLLLFLGAGMLFFAAVSVALSGTPVENKGAAEIKLPGGERGAVPFPHHQHQNNLVDCKICHANNAILKNRARGQVLCWCSAFREAREKEETHLFY